MIFRVVLLFFPVSALWALVPSFSLRAKVAMTAATTNNIERLLVSPTTALSTREVLKSSIQQWLDEEWIEQECHAKIAECAARSYYDAVAKRGLYELGDLLVALGGALSEEEMKEAFVEAYVGPWDVANYCSDIIAMSITGETVCGQDEELMSTAKTIRDAVKAEEKPLPKEAPRQHSKLLESVWTFKCTLETRSFEFTAKLLGDPEEPYLSEIQGDVEVIDDASGLIEKPLVWVTEKENEGFWPRDSTGGDVVFNLSFKPIATILGDTDGDTLYLKARVRTLEGTKALAFEEGTLQVKRREIVNFLFFQYPSSLVAQLTDIGAFTATAA